MPDVFTQSLGVWSRIASDDLASPPGVVLLDVIGQLFHALDVHAVGTKELLRVARTCVTHYWALDNLLGAKNLVLWDGLEVHVFLLASSAGVDAFESHPLQEVHVHPTESFIWFQP